MKTIIGKKNAAMALVTGAAFLAMSASLTISANAHSLYIQSGRYAVSAGNSSPLFFCFGHHFPVDSSLRSKKLRSINLLSPDGTRKEIDIRDGRSLHSYDIKYTMPGTYVLTAETNPGFFAMYTDKKGRKRHSLKPKHVWVDKAVEIESSMRSSQWTKTYVTCERPSEEFPAFVGLPLELVPVNTKFAALKEGDSVELQAYLNGRPYEGEGEWDATYGGFSTEVEDLFLPRTKVNGGKIVIPLTHSGRWFVRFFTKTEAAPKDKEDCLQEKLTTTLSFMVKNKRRHLKPQSEK